MCIYIFRHNHNAKLLKFRPSSSRSTNPLGNRGYSKKNIEYRVPRCLFSLPSSDVRRIGSARLSRTGRKGVTFGARTKGQVDRSGPRRSREMKVCARPRARNLVERRRNGARRSAESARGGQEGRKEGRYRLLTFRTTRARLRRASYENGDVPPRARERVAETHARARARPLETTTGTGRPPSAEAYPRIARASVGGKRRGERETEKEERKRERESDATRRATRTTRTFTRDAATRDRALPRERPSRH